MKKVLVAFILIGLFQPTTFAACATAVSRCQVNACPYQTPCECTDPGWRSNNCIDPCSFCEAFGNIGAR